MKYLSHSEIKQKLKLLKNEFNNISEQIEVLNKRQKQIKEKEKLVQSQCNHVDDGGFMYGFCKICKEFLG